QAIERRRALLTDMLLFDVLLSLGGIREPDALYPPQDVEQLEQLLDAISNSKYDQLKRDCLVYFLLKWYQDAREAKFQLSRCLPPQFCALSDAYWYLDSGITIEKAVTILADHRLVCDYASKILLAISHSDDPATLIIKYVRTAKPRLIEQEDIGIYTLALAEKHLYEAWQFQRTFNESDETRPKLLKRLFE
ncbi:ELYS-like domain-containing protein, partial [Mucidula mucida]